MFNAQVFENFLLALFEKSQILLSFCFSNTPPDKCFIFSKKCMLLFILGLSLKGGFKD